ncbi:drug:h+ antiporter [Coprinellus micaceus]|uniref:Drug:h+ antiporter n=1 Tax=Coprinellus micaceus TaxID=71717 RepID=A0A4Y7SJ49_COPMI|nr:drug:h+ antiporter [Coprinellus micaceus]
MRGEEKLTRKNDTGTQTQRDVDAVSIQSEDVGHEGVKTVQATHRVFGRYSKWALFVSLGLAAYIYSLDGTTTYAYLAFAVSSFGRHSFISTIQSPSGKPVIAKIADVRSRGFAYVFVLIFYVVGYIVIASAKNAESIAGGIIVGYTGLQLLTQIIIADITTLKWRALVSASMSLPFVINAFVGSNINARRRRVALGYGMFAILVPAALAPLIGRSRRGYIVKSVPKERTVTQRLVSTAQKLDVVGLALLGTSVALILLPMTLARSAEGGWRNPSMIAMEVVGIVLLPVYFLYSAYLAKVPVVPKRFLRNRSVVLACLVGAFDFISFYISYTYLYSFVLIVKPWPLIHATYFAQTQTVALTVFAIVAGVIARFTRRYKAILIAGLAIRLLGAGDAEVVWSQLLQGIGGGFAAVMAQTGAQASVKHADTAMVTAVVLLVTEIGGSIGSAIAGSIWTSLMPDKLEQYLPFVDAETRAQLFGSLYVVAAEPRGTYDDVMKVLCIAATAFAVPPLLMAFFMPDWYLGEGQNAVEGLGLDGHRVEGAFTHSYVLSLPLLPGLELRDLLSTRQGGGN